jgi:putative spermidine/putrescine transport system substrate-binding protein
VVSFHRTRRTCALVALSLCVAGCNPGFDDAEPTVGSTVPVTTAVATSAEVTPEADPLSALADRCRADGATVSLVGLPDDWVRYGDILAALAARFPGVTSVVADPAASSTDQQALVTETVATPESPDSVEVSAGVMDEMVADDLLAPFTPSVADDLVAGARGPADEWVAPYVLTSVIVTNLELVTVAPTSWSALTDPSLRGLVALAGDPRTSPGALAVVMAAALANGGSADDITPGIEFFAQLAREGILSGTDGSAESAASGETPVVLDWSAGAWTVAEALDNEGLEARVAFPTDGLAGTVLPTGLVRDAPHRACGELWVEFLVSDEAATVFASGGAIPTRRIGLERASVVAPIPLVPVDQYDSIVIPTAAQWSAARAIVEEQWASAVLI